MHVCHFGGFDPDYSRNLVFREALSARGHTVVDCSSRHPNVILRQAEALRKARVAARHCDIVVVGTVAHYSMPFAYALTRALGRPLVFDVFDSFWETAVYDTRQLDATSLHAQLYRHFDRSMVGLADLAVVDTALHARVFEEEIGVPPGRMRHVPVGVDESLFDRRVAPDRARGDDDSFVAGFVGSFFRSHGIDTILRAAQLLEREGAGVRFDLYGDGPVIHETRALARRLRLGSVTFHGRVPYRRVPALVQGFDVVLGLFGDTGKVRNVVPNKAYEAAAMAKPLITGDTPGMRAAFDDDAEVSLVPLADPSALADGLWMLKDAPDRRARMARAIRRRFETDFSLAAIGDRWERILNEAVALRGGRR